MKPRAPERADHRPLEDSPPGGLGLALVRGLSASARYARLDDRNRITLTVPTEGSPPARPPPRADAGGAGRRLNVAPPHEPRATTP